MSRDEMQSLMILFIPYMKSIMWVGAALVAFSLLSIALTFIFRSGVAKRLTLLLITIIAAIGLIFLAGQYIGVQLGTPPSMNLSSPGEFPFRLLRFSTIGGVFLLAAGTLIIPLLFMRKSSDYSQPNNGDTGASKLANTLVGSGFVILLIAVFWWVQFYQGVARELKSSLSAAIPCLYSSADECAVIIGLSRLGGISPYNPIVFWIGAVLLGVGLILSITLKKN